MLGNGRLEARAFDDSGTMRLASIRGKLRKKVWYVYFSTGTWPDAEMPKGLK